MLSFLKAFLWTANKPWLMATQQGAAEHAAQVVQNITNPLINQLPSSLQADAKRFNQMTQQQLRIE